MDVHPELILPKYFDKKVATRDAYGKTLLNLGRENPDIVVLNADLSESARTGWFAKEFPERFFNVGVAEQNMIGIAAGLALGGKLPFVSSFAIFLTGRAWEPIRQSICYPNLNVKLVSSHAGLTVGEDGASHQSLEDITIMRVLPNMRVFVPADAEQTNRIVRYIAESPGPVYMRTSRPSSYRIFKPEYTFNPDVPDYLVRGEKILILSTGLMTAQALKACEILSDEGLYPGLVHIHTLKPLPQGPLREYAKNYQCILTVEEHSVIGGLGSAVTELFAEIMPMRIVRGGMRTFGKSGAPDVLLDKFGLSAGKIADKVRSLWNEYRQ